VAQITQGRLGVSSMFASKFKIVRAQLRNIVVPALEWRKRRDLVTWWDRRTLHCGFTSPGVAPRSFILPFDEGFEILPTSNKPSILDQEVTQESCRNAAHPLPMARSSNASGHPRLDQAHRPKSPSRTRTTLGKRLS
jgi:hypothetical protein